MNAPTAETSSKNKPIKLFYTIKGISSGLSLYFMMIPGILFILIFNYVPMYGLMIAFKNYNEIKGVMKSPWAGLNNFKFFFTSQDAFRVTFNTLKYNAIFISSVIIVSLVFAIMMSEIRNRILSKFYQSFMFIPFFLSWVVVGYLSYAFFNVDQGFLNGILRVFGKDPVQWYAEPRYWNVILPLANLWKNTGYYSVIFLAAITNINSEYYEAAEIDGAGKLQQILKITLPHLSSLVCILTLLMIGRIFYADFGLFYNLPRETGVLFRTTDVIDTYVFRALRTMGDIGMASAVGFYQSLVGFTLVLLSNIVVRKVNPENALF